jgi:ATP-dependent protease ClpP protease subunit
MSSTDTTYIKFFAIVDGNSTKTLMDIIDQKVLEGKKKIVVLISSGGGSVFHGISIYNYLSGIPLEVETHNFGSVDSIGVILYLAGKKRYSVPDARFLIHAVQSNFQGNLALEEKQLEERLKSLQIDVQNIAGIISKGTGKKREEIIQKMHDRTTLNPEEAKTFGLVHEIKKELFPIGAEVITINMHP